jgi:Tfp pilus assembly protein PilO
LPQHHEIHRVLRDVTKIAEKHHLDTKLFKTLKPEVSAGYSEQPIEMSLLGDFDSFYQFMLELEKMQRITKVKVMDLEKSKEKEGMTKSDMELSIYFANRTNSN